MMKYFLVFLLFSLSFIQPCFSTSFSGFGSGFVYKFFQKTFNEYTYDTNIELSYSPVGSKEGFNNLINFSGDFAGIDMFLSDNFLKNYDSPQEFLHIPVSLNGIGIIFNLDGISNISLSAELLSLIFQKKITQWNDSRIQQLNPMVVLPNIDIILITRDHPSGSTYLLTQYLSFFNEAWNRAIGSKSLLTIPGSLNAESSVHMGNLVSQINGSLGYIDFSYSHDFDLNFIGIENLSKTFVKPSFNTISNAASISMPSDGRIICITSEQPQAYPITSFTWLLIYKDQYYNQRSYNYAQQFHSFLSWIINHSQDYAVMMGYPKLPGPAIKLSESLVNSMTYNGSLIKP